MEIFILVGVALIVVGPDKLPKLARDMAKFINDIKRTTSSITNEINNSLAKEELEKKLKLDENKDDQSSLDKDTDDEDFDHHEQDHDHYDHEDKHDHNYDHEHHEGADLHHQNHEELPPEDPLGNLTKKNNTDKTPLNDNPATKEKSDV